MMRDLGWTRLRAAALAWDRAWSPALHPRVLALHRRLLGAYLALYYLGLAPGWLDLYGPAGTSPLRTRGLDEASLHTPALLLHLESTPALAAYWVASFAAAAWLASGRGGRGATAWLWVANLGMLYRNPGVVNGEEQVLAVLLLGGLFLPGRLEEARPSAALRWLQLQLAWIYLVSWPFKLASEASWLDGTVVWYGIGSLAYSRWPGCALFSAGGGILSRVLTWGTLALELAFALGVWAPRRRVPLTLALMALHLGIAIFLEGLAAFNLVMVVGLVLFLPGDRLPRERGAR